MRVVLCLDGSEASSVIARAVARLTRLEGAELTLLHVRDTEVRALMEFTRRRHGAPPLPPRRSSDLDSAEDARAETVLTQTRDALSSQTPGLIIRYEVRVGQPERAIVELLRETQADLVVLGARPGAAPGPHSIGHVARYVLDHAPCSALIVR